MSEIEVFGELEAEVYTEFLNWATEAKGNSVFDLIDRAYNTDDQTAKLEVREMFNEFWKQKAGI